MAKLIDLTGKRFGKLVVIACSERNKHGQRTWLCKCDCGTEKRIVGHHLRQGSSRSCGCEGVKITHAQTGTRIYRTWSLMLDRCTNPNSPGWPRYGGRGIAVCDSWKEFENFLRDMGHPPEGMSLDRKNNDGPYAPWNCRWATKIQQANNSSANRIVEVDGTSMTLAEAARLRGIDYKTLHSRLRNGMDLEKALSAKRFRNPRKGVA